MLNTFFFIIIYSIFSFNSNFGAYGVMDWIHGTDKHHTKKKAQDLKAD